jgi:hypothetical protein
MELLRLDSGFNPNRNIDNYESLIWSERYQKAGDFQLKTRDVRKFRSLLPVGSYLGLGESTRGCMVVETHSVKYDKKQGDVLTISGRSWETFLENRIARPIGPNMPLNKVVNGKDVSNDWVFTGLPAYRVGVSLIQKAITSNTEYDLTIPNLRLTTSADPSKTYANISTIMELGSVYERLMELLAIDDFGIEALRNFGDREGPYLRIYNGRDKTATVIFSTEQGHFDSANYVWTNRDHKNTVSGYSYYGVENTSFATIVNPLNRRIAAEQYTDLKSEDGSSQRDAIRVRNTSYLARTRKTVGVPGGSVLAAVFTGEVSSACPHRFRKHYNLGDLVGVLSDYDVRQNMLVTEYVRIEDEQGERAYPTLSTDLR